MDTAGGAIVGALGPGVAIVGALGPGGAIVGALGPGAAIVGALGPGGAIVGALGPGAGLAVSVKLEFLLSKTTRIMSRTTIVAASTRYFILLNSKFLFPASRVTERELQVLGGHGLEPLAVGEIILKGDVIIRHYLVIQNRGGGEGRDAAAIGHSHTLRHLLFDYILF